MYRPAIRPSRHALQNPAPAVLGPARLLARRTLSHATASGSAPPGAILSGLVVLDAGWALLATVAGLASPFAPSSAVPAVVSFPLLWVTALLAARCYDQPAVAERLDEVLRIVVAAVLALAGVALLAWGWGIDVSPGFVALTLPLAALLTLVGRAVRRRVMAHAPVRSRSARTVLLVGDRRAAGQLRERFAREAGGHRVVGYCLPTARGIAPPLPGLPALGGLTDVAEVARRLEVDTVVVVPSADLDGIGVEQLDRQVAAAGADLLLASPLTDLIAARRARIRSLAGIRLLQLDRPRTDDRRGRAVSIRDRVVAAGMIVAIAPVLVAISVGVALSCHGPVLVRERRSWPDGTVFGVLRFRAELSSSDGDLTKVGSMLRRGHLDELPRLVDVLRGDLPLCRCIRTGGAQGPAKPRRDTTRGGGDSNRA